MDDALADAIGYSHTRGWDWPPVVEGTPIELEEDRLIVSTIINEIVRSRIDYTRTGVIRLQEYLDGDVGEIKYAGASQFIKVIQVQPDEIARRIALFARFVNRALRPVFGIRAMLKWTINEADHLQLIASPGWTQTGAQIPLVTRNELCTLPEQDWTIDSLKDDYLASQLTSTIRELLYPFSARSGLGRLVRINPSAQIIGDLVDRLPTYLPYTEPLPA
jgi:hypothetical protein